jgi:hypothetical protein
MIIAQEPTVPRSPWQNGHIGRLIGSIRRECLDHIVVGGKHPLPLRAIQPAGKFPLSLSLHSARFCS